MKISKKYTFSLLILDLFAACSSAQDNIVIKISNERFIWFLKQIQTFGQQKILYQNAIWEDLFNDILIEKIQQMFRMWLEMNENTMTSRRGLGICEWVLLICALWDLLEKYTTNLFDQGIKYDYSIYNLFYLRSYIRGIFNKFSKKQKNLQ